MDKNTSLSDEDINAPVENTQPMGSIHEQEQDVSEQMTPKTAVKNEPSAWIDQKEIDYLRSKWTSIQAQFVDQPRAAVEQAEALVADAVERITHLLTEQQTSLSGQWCNHEDVSTEDLRITLQNYRSFLNTLLDH